jgi:hypothetical protein
VRPAVERLRLGSGKLGQLLRFVDWIAS